MFAKSFEHVTTIQILILTPLNIFRYGIPGVSDVPIGTAFSLVCALGAVLFLTAVKLMARGTGFRE
jgi:ABC-2 type transport system permease protein